MEVATHTNGPHPPGFLPCQTLAGLANSKPGTGCRNGSWGWLLEKAITVVISQKYVHVYIYIYISYIHIGIHVCMYNMCIILSISIYMYIYMYIYIYMYVYIYICLYIYIYILALVSLRKKLGFLGSPMAPQRRCPPHSKRQRWRLRWRGVWEGGIPTGAPSQA